MLLTKEIKVYTINSSRVISEACYLHIQGTICHLTQDLDQYYSGRGLQYRKDREGLKRLIQSDPRYQQLDADTLETMSVMLEWPSVWRQREKCIMNDTEDYDMCQAVREWAEEERSIGRLEGRKEGAEESRIIIIKNMLNRGMADEDIMAIAECDRKLLEDIRNK